MSIKYLPFGDEKYGRIYKGEGTLSFVCFQPYAICKNKYLQDYSDYSNLNEWAASSRMLQNNEGLDTLGSDGVIKVYNPGVKETEWIMTFEAAEDRNFLGGQISMGENYLVFSKCEAKIKNGNYDTRITFNSKTGLVEGWYATETQADG
jgi:hypothetical protein